VTGRRSYSQDCPIATGLDVLGERWTLLILRELVGGPRRYSDLRAQLPGIATNLLAQRLEELQQSGVVERTDLPPPIARTVYTLTDKGLEALRQWARRPVSFTPLKSEPLIRLLICDLVGEQITRESMLALRDDIADIERRLDDAELRAAALPHRPPLSGRAAATHQRCW